jgi:hypothetical protein
VAGSLGSLEARCPEPAPGNELTDMGVHRLVMGVGSAQGQAGQQEGWGLGSKCQRAHPVHMGLEGGAKVGPGREQPGPGPTESSSILEVQPG